MHETIWKTRSNKCYFIGSASVFPVRVAYVAAQLVPQGAAACVHNLGPALREHLAPALYICGGWAFGFLF